jgi:HlyD family secretion protein
MIKNEDVGFVYEGQRVKIKLATFPFQKYGMIEGTVRTVSADAAEFRGQNSPNESNEQERSAVSPYKALVSLDSQRLHHGNANLALAAGMQVVAESREGERTVIEYLLSPVAKVVSEAARER